MGGSEKLKQTISQSMICMQSKPSLSFSAGVLVLSRLNRITHNLCKTYPIQKPSVETRLQRSIVMKLRFPDDDSAGDAT